ncbi:MAG: hypothetical protein M3114_06975 [Thermoproteota archaeon]|nr:hypothetical protein [Thermoproteota archaeon]
MQKIDLKKRKETAATIVSNLIAAKIAAFIDFELHMWELINNIYGSICMKIAG